MHLRARGQFPGPSGRLEQSFSRRMFSYAKYADKKWILRDHSGRIEVSRLITSYVCTLSRVFAQRYEHDSASRGYVLASPYERLRARGKPPRSGVPAAWKNVAMASNSTLKTGSSNSKNEAHVASSLIPHYTAATRLKAPRLRINDVLPDIIRALAGHLSVS